MMIEDMTKWVAKCLNQGFSPMHDAFFGGSTVRE